jgi:choline dehydrogenase-like flavoprotein
MIEDLREFPRGTTVNADICLIGAGAAGITIARELAGGPLHVCLVEGGGLEFEEDTQALYAGQDVGAPVSLEGGRLRFFGGSTNHWGGRCTPLEPIDFRKRDWVPYSGWPIDREQLDPYYLRAREVAGFPEPWRTDADTLSYLKTAPPAVNPAWFRPYLWRYAPTMKDAGEWNWGLAYRKTLKDARNIRVLLHANFSAFSTVEDRSRVRSLTVKSLNGTAATIVAKTYVLCTGGIENARLLLLGAEQNGGGFGNQNDLAGRFFLQHPHGQSGVIVSAERLARLQEQFNILTGANGLEVEVGLALTPEIQEQQGLLNCSVYLQYLGDPESGVTAAQDIWRSLLTGHWAPDMGEKVARIGGDFGSVARSVQRRLSAGHSLELEGSAGVPSRAASVQLWIEQAPDPQSRVSLADDRDALGLRRVKTDWRIGEHERRTAAAATSLLGADFARLGIGRCRLDPWLQDASASLTEPLKDSYHYIGTTRMSDDPRQGVVDRNCAVHGMGNLFVAGSSVFPTAGHANPTFTLVALALRLADHLQGKPGGHAGVA